MRRFFPCFLAIFVSFFFFSCSDSEADVIAANATAVFDFSDEESVPATRLAVFFQVANEVQRTESFTVSSNGSGYYWTVSNPSVFTAMNKSYAYSVNLSPPSGENIAVGPYSVKYYDAAGKEDQFDFSVSYNEALVSAKSSEVKELLPSAVENIAIYSDSGELLFMGKAKSSWKTNEDILKDYKLAQTKRICYVTPGNTVICMMPEEKLKAEN